MISKLIEIKELAVEVRNARENTKQEKRKLEVLNSAEGVEQIIAEQKENIIKATERENEAIDNLLKAIDIL